MEIELQELIDKLIDKGWKPRGIYTSLLVGYGLVRCEEFVGSPRNERKSYRELVSKESGLRQFVCEMSVNNYNKEKGKVLTWKKFEDDKYQINGYSNGGGYIQDYEYWLIESALCDVDKLEQFLIENIKI